MDTNNTSEVVIIGAGVAGLICALELEKRNIKPLIIEASDRVGGRVKTDIKDGFLLDHGFQVLLTAYPEARNYLDYKALELCHFSPGAVIYDDHKSYEITDPLRQPASALSMLFSPIGTFSDKMKMAGLASRLKKKSISSIFGQPETTTYEHLKSIGFSDQIITKFFRPFFGGIYLENELVTSNRMFDFVFKMFSEGHAAIPALGIEEIPKQLKSLLKQTEFKFNTRVTDIDQAITLESGEVIEAKKVVIATTPEKLMRGLDSSTEYQSVLNLYFATDVAIINKPMIGLVPDSSKLINNFCDLTAVSSKYSGGGRRLVSVSVNDDAQVSVADKVKAELAELSGINPDKFEHIASYHIPKALPVNRDLRYDMPYTEVKIHDNVFLSGDYLLNASLNAAMLSGRRAAEAVVQSL